MAFSYAVISKVGKEWHVTVSDYAMSHEAEGKTLEDILKQTKRIIEKVSEPKEATT